MEDTFFSWEMVSCNCRSCSSVKRYFFVLFFICGRIQVTRQSGTGSENFVWRSAYRKWGQLFYTYRDREFSGDYFQGETGSGEELKEMSFLLSDLDWGEMSYRLDLLLEEDAFTISRMFITYEDEILLEIKKGDLEQYIAKLDACEYGSTPGRFHVLSGVPSLYFNDYFSESLYEVTDGIVKTEQLERISGANWNLLRIAFLSYFILFIFWFCGRHDPDEKGLSAQNTKSAGWKSVIAMVAAVILVWNFVLVLCVFFSQNIESILNPKALPAKPG